MSASPRARAKSAPKALDAEEAFAYLQSARTADALDALCAAATQRRDHRYADALSFSPKVFLPITTLCRNRCDYCTFRRSPGEEGAKTMTFQEVEKVVAEGARIGCTEALLCLGDKPEKGFSAYRRELERRGLTSTVDHLVRSCQIALDHGMWPHTNAGILNEEDLTRLRPLNASMGLMLENSSPRLCEKGMPHHRAPDKRPAVRIAMLELAGRLKIPFTSGILIGIGETREERVQSLLVLRDLHEKYGHIQEIIVQNFRAKDGTRMAGMEEPSTDALRESIALARLIMPLDVSVQAPPNLAPGGIQMLVDAGVNDFGGVSPITPDFINPERPWPHLSQLRSDTEVLGRRLVARLPIYDAWLNDEWVDATILPDLRAANERMKSWWTDALSAKSAVSANPSVPSSQGAR